MEEHKSTRIHVAKNGNAQIIKNSAVWAAQSMALEVSVAEGSKSVYVPQVCSNNYSPTLGDNQGS